MSDRQLWLEEPCPTCGARSGLRCQTSRYGGKPTRFLHAARGWRGRSCPTCKAQPGELCKTPTGRRAAQPHTARLHPGRRELFAEQGVWEELERWEAATALVRFSGGGGSQGSIAAVTLEDAKKRELARWGSGEGELPEALAAPIWARYALFRGHPRISGLLMWDVQERQVVIAGERGGAEVRGAAVRSEAALPPTRHARGRHRGRRVARVRCPGGPRHLASRCPGGLALVRALRRAAPAGAASGGALLLQALPAGRLARAAEGPSSLPAAQPRRDVRVVRGADARRRASGGTVLLQALPAGVLPARSQATAATLRRPRARTGRPALGAPRRRGSGGCGWSVWRWAT